MTLTLYYGKIKVRTLLSAFLERNILMEQKICKAACYCRLSSDDLNDGLSISISTQMALAERYCKENHIQILDFYCDDGFTGTNFDRPAFKRMMADIGQGKADTIIVKDFSRFGREHIMVDYYTQVYFPEHNIRFISISDNVVITPNSRYDIMLPLKSVLNEFYPAEISVKVRQAMDVKAQNGEFLQPWLPYGYVKSDKLKNRLVIDEETASVVRKIFELAAYESYGLVRIADYLYEHRVLSPMALKNLRNGESVGENPYSWSKTTIGNLLNNEVYLGRIVYGKSRKLNFKSKKIVRPDKSEWIVVENAHEAIISQKLWDDAHARIDSRKRVNKGTSENIFRGLLKCDDCGATMRITSPLHKKMFYVCAGSKKKAGGKECCTTHNIQHEALYNAVLSDIQGVLSEFNQDEQKFRQRVLEHISDVHFDIDKVKQSIADLETQLAREKKKYKKLYDDYYNGIIKDSDLFEEMSAECCERMEILKSRKEALEKELNAGNNYSDDTDKFLSVLRDCFVIEELDKETLNKLIDKITVGEKTRTEDGQTFQKVKIFYRFVGYLND